MREREALFSKFGSIHPSTSHTNISNLAATLSLRPGTFVLVYHRGNILIGEGTYSHPAFTPHCSHATLVVTIYTKTAAKNAKHGWIPEVTSLGAVSNVGIQVCIPFNGNLFTTVACPKLGCATFLLVPATQVLFSLSPSVPGKQQISTGRGHKFTLVTFEQSSIELYARWVDRTHEVADAIASLRKVLASAKRA